MIAAHTRAAGEAGMILAMGVRSDPNTQRMIAGIMRQGVECGSCGTNYATTTARADPSCLFRDAAGCGLCIACYDEAGVENEHADGHHSGAPEPRCADCREVSG